MLFHEVWSNTPTFKIAEAMVSSGQICTDVKKDSYSHYHGEKFDLKQYSMKKLIRTLSDDVYFCSIRNF